MTSHTPGPWAYHARLSGSENHHGFRIGAKFFLAEVMPIDSDGIEGEANARLISEAPELLRLALLIESAISSQLVLNSPWISEQNADICRDLLERARESISRIDGKKP